MSAPVLILIFLFVLVVSEDDLLHKLMTYNVAVCELMDRDALDTVEDPDRRPETADLSAGKVGLQP